MADFVHLNVHSEYSLTDSLIRIKDLNQKLNENNSQAVAITDKNNLFSCIRFYKNANSNGIKPIIGAELNLDYGENRTGKITVLCKNNEGYQNLMQLLSDLYSEIENEEDKEPVFPARQLSNYSGGLIALSGARHGILATIIKEGDMAVADTVIQYHKNLFSDGYFLELQRTGHPEDEDLVHKSVELAVKNKVPVVATNAVHFLNMEDFDAHEIRRSIAEKITVSEYRKTFKDEVTQEQYLKSPQQMTELFKDIPSAIENTVKISQSCNVDITLGKNFLPKFPVMKGETEADHLRKKAEDGLAEHLEHILDKTDPDYDKKRQVYYDRLYFELDVINSMGFPGYFLIVSEFIQWSKNHDIPVGPGRGSGAGSIVAYSLKITNLDPIKYDLLFERFLNPERVSMPDFDIDFCMDRRDEVIAHVAEKYGHKAVSQIVTFGTMAARSVVRDVNRVMGNSYMVGDRIAKLIPSAPGTKLKDALEQNMEFATIYETDREAHKIIDLAMSLEGITRQTGKHAGGVLIAPNNLTEFTPTYNLSDGSGFVSQYDKNDVEEAGLVKFDFLGLRTLTIIQNAVNIINENKLDKIDINNIPLDDEETYKTFKDGKTTAVFQLESKGMKDLLVKLKPENFEDIIALIALYRPGPLEAGMVDDFVNRKNGHAAVEFLHPLLEPVLKNTYGVIVYQEQVMQAAQVLAGYSLGQADMLRRAMGKKKPEEMAKQRSIFVTGCEKNGIDKQKATDIFNIIEKFAGYGFNKSHSAAYALIAYQTAFLKTHYPEAFMASVLSSDMNNTDKVVGFIHECKEMGIDVLSPDINISKKGFTVNNENQIVFGLGAVKGVGERAIKNILTERSYHGKYDGLYDFCLRANPNKTVIESSIRSGALNNFEKSRSKLMSIYPDLQKHVKKTKTKQSKNKNKSDQIDFLDKETNSNIEDLLKKDIKPWSKQQLLENEYKVLGLYLSDHPYNYHREEMKDFVSGSLIDLTEISTEVEDEKKTYARKPVKVAGTINSIDLRVNKRGHTAYIKLDDGTRQLDLNIYNKTYHHCQHVLKVGNTLFIEGELNRNFKNNQINIIAHKIKDIQMMRDQYLNKLNININTNDNEKLNQLIEILKDNPGFTYIDASIDENISSDFDFNNYRVKVSDEMLHEIRHLLGNDSVKPVYRESSEQTIESVLDDQLRETELLERRKQEGLSTIDERTKKIEYQLNQAKIAMGLTLKDLTNDSSMSI